MDEPNLEEPQQLPLPDPRVQEQTHESDPESPEIVALRAQLAETQRQVSDANTQRDAANSRFDQYLERAPQTPAPAVQRIDPSLAPDPAVDPEAFQRHSLAVREQDQRDLDNRLRETQESIRRDSQAGIAQLQAQQGASQLWADLVGAHPEHASRKDIANLAFTRIYGDKMPTDTSGVIAAVALKMDEMIGNPTPAPNRTGGVGGGSAPPRAPAPKKQEEQPKSMIDIMLDHQLEQGLI